MRKIFLPFAFAIIIGCSSDNGNSIDNSSIVGNWKRVELFSQLVENGEFQHGFFIDESDCQYNEVSLVVHNNNHAIQYFYSDLSGSCQIDQEISSEIILSNGIYYLKSGHILLELREINGYLYLKHNTGDNLWDRFERL